MLDPTSSPLDNLGLDILERLHDVCEEFERDWSSGSRPNLDEFLARVPDDGTTAAFGELLDLELVYRIRNGEIPTVDEYLARYPHRQSEIHAAWHQRSLDSTDHLPISQLGDFQMLRELGRGGMGVVYLAKQISLDRHVAIKVVAQSVIADPTVGKRFQREARSTAALQHANIVPVYGVGCDRGIFYFAMRFIDGESLERVIQRWRETGKRIDRDHCKIVARVMLQAAEAVQYAHQEGILHRDLKPSNLLLDFDAKLWVTDFGLARPLTDTQELTRTGNVAGTLRYMAPEAMEIHDDVRSDVYGLGLTLYELLILQRRFPETEQLRLIENVFRGGDPIPPRRIRSRIPADLETICLKCIRRERSERYATAGALAADLKSFLDGRPIQARPIPLWTKTALWAKRRPGIAGLSLAVLFTTIVALVGLIWAVGASSRWAREAGRRAAAESKRADLEKQRAEAVQSLVETERAARKREQALRQKAQAALVRARVVLAENLWRLEQVPAARNILALCAPKPGEADHRGWEWHYVDHLCNAELQVLDHVYWVNTVAFSSDGSQLATGGGLPGRGVGDPKLNGELKVWNVSTGQLVVTLIDPDQPAVNVQRVEFSPDGRWLLAGDADGSWRVWETAGWEAVAVVSGLDAGCLPNCDTLAVIGMDGELSHVDLVERGDPKQIRGPINKYENRLAARFSSDKRRCVIRAFDFESVYVVDSLTGEDVRELKAPHSPGTVAVSPGGNRVVASERLWDVATGRELGSMAPDGGPVIAPTFSHDGRWLAWTADPREELRIAAMESFDKLRRWKHSGAITKAAFSPDNQYLAAAGDNQSVRLRHVATGKPDRVLAGHKTGGRAVCFSPDGRRIATAGQDCTARLWDHTIDPRGTIIQPPDSRGELFGDIAFADDGCELVLAHGTSFPEYNVARIDIASGTVLARASVDRRSMSGAVRALCRFSGDGALLVAASMTQPMQVNVWENRIICGASNTVSDSPTTATAIPTPLRTLIGHSKTVQSVAVNHDGSHIASVAWSDADPMAELIVWDSAGKPRLTVKGPRIDCLAISSDGQLVAAAGADGFVRVWNTNSEQQPFSLPPQPAPVTCLAFNRDGSCLAAATRKGVPVWETANGDLRFRLSTPSRYITGLDFSPDDRRLATAAIDEEAIHLWDNATGEDMFALRRFSTARPEQFGFVSRVAFSDDGKQIVANNWNNSLNIWSIGR